MMRDIQDIEARLVKMTVVLYTEGYYPGFKPEAIADYLLTKVGVRRVELRPNPIAPTRVGEAYDPSRQLAACRVYDPMGRSPNDPLQAEIGHERRLLMSGRISPGIVYDGLRVQRIMLDHLNEDKRTSDRAHIILTQRLLATRGSGDGRYHLRTVVCGFPSLVSLTGLVEAPARDPAFYWMRRRLGGLASSGLLDRAAGQCLVYGDPKTTQVSIGYVMQSLAYALWGEPFCSEPTCRLYNAHKQGEMLHAQLGEPEYCRDHQGLLARYRVAN